MNPLDSLINGVKGKIDTLMNAFASQSGGTRVTALAEKHTRSAFQAIEKPGVKTVNIFIINNNGSGSMTINIPPIAIDPGNGKPPLASINDAWLMGSELTTLSNIIILSSFAYGISCYFESLSYTSTPLNDLSYDYQTEISVWEDLLKVEKS